ncbi:MAG: chorismate lyase [Oceanicoccus sp.]|uniref:chorismate--pyruvate lyase family protein n=1 Tax=Oceanicoccus sp. TaxID=2691044 RepID=UPI002615BDC5|nr:chorismate lyase [Oceanicoccus sp.]MCP3907971.1 chorismate lyase [Oceanicoccus sp.]MDG1772149.1 chorismate lyase [Oceanicoccus sp.]
MYALQPSGYHPTESNWQDYHHFTSSQLPGSVRPWLLDRGSLTQRLIKSSRGQFKVQVLKQQWQRPRLSEATLLGMQHREMAIIREVALLCGGQPWVFARSVMPASSLVGRLRRLRKFNDSSLGEMLFRDPSMQRHPFQIASIEGNSSQLPASLQQETTLWGRRCRFELATKPIMVSEIFLPAFKP